MKGILDGSQNPETPHYGIEMSENLQRSDFTGNYGPRSRTLPLQDSGDEADLHHRE
jgi:hypothetical protein